MGGLWHCFTHIRRFIKQGPVHKNINIRRAVRDGGGASKDFGLGLCHGFINHPWGHCGVH